MEQSPSSTASASKLFTAEGHTSYCGLDHGPHKHMRAGSQAT
jgi:hypothetical protein